MKITHTEKVGEISKTTEIEFLNLTNDVKEVLIYLGIKEEEKGEEKGKHEENQKKNIGDYELLS